MRRILALSLLSALPARAEVICMRLHPGESLRVQYSSAESPTGVSAGYRLTRKTETEYLVELNLHYRPAADYDGKLKTDEEIDDFYRAKISGCMKEYSDRLAHQGAKLEVKLASMGLVPRHDIDIHKRGFRSNSLNYESDVDCPTMLHETLHLLGLADEYDGDSSGFKVENGRLVFAHDGTATYHYNCRIPGDYDSVMNEQNLAVLNSTAMEEVEVRECHCPPEVDCEKVAEKATGSECPEGTTAKSAKQFLMPGDKVANIVNPAFFVLPGAPTVSHGKVRMHESALKPAHFRAITEPGCDTNACYYACARNAYRFELPKGSDPALTHSLLGCYPLPEGCGKPAHTCYR